MMAFSWSMSASRETVTVTPELLDALEAAGIDHVTILKLVGQLQITKPVASVRSIVRALAALKIRIGFSAQLAKLSASRAELMSDRVIMTPLGAWASPSAFQERMSFVVSREENLLRRQRIAQLEEQCRYFEASPRPNRVYVIDPPDLIPLARELSSINFVMDARFASQDATFTLMGLPILQPANSIAVTFWPVLIQRTTSSARSIIPPTTFILKEGGEPQSSSTLSIHPHLFDYGGMCNGNARWPKTILGNFTELTRYIHGYNPRSLANSNWPLSARSWWATYGTQFFQEYPEAQCIVGPRASQESATVQSLDSDLVQRMVNANTGWISGPRTRAPAVIRTGDVWYTRNIQHRYCECGNRATLVRHRSGSRITEAKCDHHAMLADPSLPIPPPRSDVLPYNMSIVRPHAGRCDINGSVHDVLASRIIRGYTTNYQPLTVYQVRISTNILAAHDGRRPFYHQLTVCAAHARLLAIGAEEVEGAVEHWPDIDEARAAYRATMPQPVQEPTPSVVEVTPQNWITNVAITYTTDGATVSPPIIRFARVDGRLVRVDTPTT